MVLVASGRYLMMGLALDRYDTRFLVINARMSLLPYSIPLIAK